jgi:hypothetical protein
MKMKAECGVLAEELRSDRHGMSALAGCLAGPSMCLCHGEDSCIGSLCW